MDIQKPPSLVTVTKRHKLISQDAQDYGKKKTFR